MRNEKTMLNDTNNVDGVPIRENIKKNPRCCDKDFEQQKMISSTAITNGKIVGPSVLFSRGVTLKVTSLNCKIFE